MEGDNVSTGGTGLLLRYASQNSLDESSQKQVPRSGRRERTPYRNSSHTVRAFEVLQSLRRDEVFCDIKLETDDSTIVFGHKVVLASASPYFHAMFTSFEESNKDHVIIRELDSTALKLLVDFIYTAQIMVSEENVQVLLPAANLLQLHDVQDACCDFLQSQLHPTNCLGIKAFADLHGCMELLSSSESYIQQHFSEVVEGDEFLSLSSEQVVKLISSDELTVPSEEKVFECVICWVNYEASCRKDILPKLMEHVRLPLASKEYLLKRVEEEPLLKNSLECKDYIIEALNFHLLKSEQPGTIPKTIRTKPRQPVGLPKVTFSSDLFSFKISISIYTLQVILVVGGQAPKAIRSVEWYDPGTNRWQSGPEMSTRRCRAGLAVLKDRRVFAVGGFNGSLRVRTVDMLDLSSPSPCWVPTVAMLARRGTLGVAVLDNCIYAVGGFDGTSGLNSAEVFDCSTQEWRMVSNMSTRRSSVGVGVLNNLLYAVGGYDGLSRQCLKSVECYHPSTDTWTPVAEMSVRRSGAGVGVLDGVMYAVGGHDGPEVRNSVEAYRPSTGVWTSIADMHMCRRNAGVIALDGLLYVVGGDDGASNLASIEIYNPNTNTWSMLTASMNIGRSYAGVVVIDKPPHFNN
ncbi:ring canal kelch homolog isoform X1 [Rhopalosiphum padi]|uniref:ring canal kelch homolog isoform X1 n=1 Tax=Rhopalosiphum padi TaxID=40932 RepID=UPI00298E94AA|nr:ring canal kelch homolog isoform X1 [Rhopalosiphum padi]